MIELILNKKIFFDNGDFRDNGDCCDNIDTRYLKYVPSDYKAYYKTFNDEEDKINKVSAERKKYWKYVKQKLFSDLKNGNRGLICIADLSDDILREIANAIFSSKGIYRHTTIIYSF